MATQPTNLPVPNESPRDLKFNAGKIDEFVTSLVTTYIDRFGNEHYTIEGLRWLAQQAISQYGYITLDSFETGNTVSLPNQVLRYEATGEYYRWDGALPKAVTAGSTPESTGGVGVGAWLSVGDATAMAALNQLIIELSSGSIDKGDALIGVKQPFNDTVNRTQHDKNAETLSIRDFYNPADTDWTNAFKKAARVSADEGKIIFIPAGEYIVSDSIPLYDDGYGTVPSPDVQSYNKGNGTKFIGEGRKTVIIKNAQSSKDINAVFYIDSSNIIPAENGKRGMNISHMSIIDLTDNSVGIYNNNGVVCSHFEDLIIMARRVGVWVGGAFVDVTFHGVIVHGHDDEATYPMDYGFRVGAGTETSISMDRCHVGHVQQDAYEIRSQYSKIGVLSADNVKGIAYVFNEFRGDVQSIGSEWSTDDTQNGTLLTATNSQITIGLLSMLKKIVPLNSQLFDVTGSQLKIEQVNATDSCVFSGKPARLRSSSMLDIGYFTQYKFEQFQQAVDYDSATNTFFSIGTLAGVQYRGRQDISIHGMFTIPYSQPSGECYRIMGTKSVNRPVLVPCFF
ncbi:glycosyl hydrolase family 28-related protein [Pseudocitrobacter faecalis]|uniref:tail fiber/spike domain-containing protein n=1 Tax=Pseudocitrobacter faecalis TaxID=1398493 RepID=UPI003B9EA1DB